MGDQVVPESMISISQNTQALDHIAATARVTRLLGALPCRATIEQALRDRPRSIPWHLPPLDAIQSYFPIILFRAVFLPMLHPALVAVGDDASGTEGEFFTPDSGNVPGNSDSRIRDLAWLRWVTSCAW